MMSRRASKWLLAIEPNVRLFFFFFFFFFFNESMCTLERVMITSKLETLARLEELLYRKW